MDFFDSSGFPAASYASYSPNSDAFPSPETHDAYFTDQYTTAPDYTFGTYLNDSGSYFARAAHTTEQAPHWSPPVPSNYTGAPSVLPPGSGSGSYNPNGWSDFNPVCTSDTYNVFTAPAYASNTTSTLSPPPSHTSPQSTHSSPAATHLSPPPSHTSPQSSPAATHLSPTPSSPPSNPPPRKRGRPRLQRPLSDPTAVQKPARTPCLPHTEVERKYREKLNMELERLRRAIPTLPQSDAVGVMGSTKPSKSMVLAVAIEYIKEVERQRDEALEEVERLGGRARRKRGGGV